jgi:branched-subunit amino acid transport protein
MLFRFGVNAVGFCVGFLFGYSSYQLLLNLLPQVAPDALRFFPQHPIAIVIAGVIVGIIGIFLARRIYIASIFIGVLSGSLYLMYVQPEQRDLLNKLLEMIGILEPLNNTLGDAWPALLALFVALAFVYLEKQAIIILTACIGSYIIADSLHIPILFLPLCFCGYLIQRKTKKSGRAASSE